MTDRINALTVVLREDLREEDVEAIKNAILQFSAVLSVGQNVSDILDYIVYSRVRHDMRQKLFEVLK